MSSFLVVKKTLDLSGSPSPHMLVGRQTRDLTASADGSVVTTMKKHFPFMVQVDFDVDGGSECTP